MAKLINFYENLEEAQRRLLRTVVTYDGEPYCVHAITNHKPDGIFRVYLLPIAADKKPIKTGFEHVSSMTPELGPLLDTWLEQNKDLGVLRKHMNSPAFNKFRPFPLGMCNHQGKTFYLERQPQRKIEQGLTRHMVTETELSASKTKMNPRMEQEHDGLHSVNIFSSSFEACVRADHPPAEVCLANLNNPDIENEAVAFHRHFCLVRGPIGMMFLGYKTDVIGVMPNNDFSRVRIGKDYEHTKEAVEELTLFNNIII